MLPVSVINDWLSLNKICEDNHMSASIDQFLIEVKSDYNDFSFRTPCITDAIHLINKHLESIAAVSEEKEEFNPDIDKAISIANNYSHVDGDHHKNWVIHSMIECLMSKEDMQNKGWLEEDWLDECVEPEVRI